MQTQTKNIPLRVILQAAVEAKDAMAADHVARALLLQGWDQHDIALWAQQVGGISGQDWTVLLQRAAVLNDE